MSQLYVPGGQNIGPSASASVLPMNIQGGFPLGLTSLISLQSRGLSRVFSSSTVQKHQFLGRSAFFMVLLTPIHDAGKTVALTVRTFVGSDVSAFLFAV